MSESILQYEKKMRDIFKMSQAEMPDLNEAYHGSVTEAVFSEGVIDLKTKRLISLAVALQAGCKDSIISQTSKALDAGAGNAELFETCSVAISMGGTLAWSKVMVVTEYLQAHGLLDVSIPE